MSLKRPITGLTGRAPRKRRPGLAIRLHSHWPGNTNCHEPATLAARQREAQPLHG